MIHLCTCEQYARLVIMLLSGSNVKPFLKWAGGKGQLLPYIRQYYPSDLGVTIKRYVEPFIGGGAVLFDVLNNYELDDVYICDINLTLINTYRVIKSQVDELIDELYEIETTYISLSADERQKYYYDLRNRFNELNINESELSVQKASYMIFLNKTCFNGLYRVNQSGLFNVPSGNYTNPTICDSTNLLATSKQLQHVSINLGHYTSLDKMIDQNTFVYFDPPYRPISTSSSFTAYTNEVFGDEQQISLANYVSTIAERGAKFMLSNSDPKNTNPDDDFFDQLYSSFNIHQILATRMINRDSKGRGKISELIITNY
jgi:DNA adenine methylase